MQNGVRAARAWPVPGGTDTPPSGSALQVGHEACLPSLALNLAKRFFKAEVVDLKDKSMGGRLVFLLVEWQVRGHILRGHGRGLRTGVWFTMETTKAGGKSWKRSGIPSWVPASRDFSLSWKRVLCVLGKCSSQCLRVIGVQRLWFLARLAAGPQPSLAGDGGGGCFLDGIIPTRPHMFSPTELPREGTLPLQGSKNSKAYFGISHG